MDHHSLRYIYDQHDLRGRKARWIELMQEFDFEIRYRKGSINRVADTLSRIPEVNALSMTEFSTGFYVSLQRLCQSDRHFGKLIRLTKMATFIPMKSTTKSPELAILFVGNLYKLYGLPEDILSDRDSKSLHTFGVMFLLILGLD